MKKIKITKRGLNLVTLEGEVTGCVTWATIVSALYASANQFDAEGCHAIADFNREMAYDIFHSKQYQDWAKKL